MSAPTAALFGYASRAAWAPALVLLGACVEPDPQDYAADPAPIEGPARLGIDRGGKVALEPGAGIGVAVEYAEGGQWSVTVACDTAFSGVSCTYDIFVSTDEESPITGYEAADLERSDDLDSPDLFGVSAQLVTEEDTDGFGFTTSPGATVRVSALLYDPGRGSWLDWSDDPRFISWVGGGAVHRGAPTNPVDLTPDRP